MTQKNNDYLSSLNKARKRRSSSSGDGKFPFGESPKDIKKFLVIIGAIAAFVCLLALIGQAFSKKTSNPDHLTATASDASEPEQTENWLPEETEPTRSEEELALEQQQREKQQVVDAYQNLGLVQVSGYLNVRSAPAIAVDNIIGKLENDGACEILSEDGGWYHIRSGGVEGYINSEFILSGEEAQTKALGLVELRAVVLVPKLWIREQPEINPENIAGHTLQNERHTILEEQGDWLKIKEGYISASSEHVEIRYALNEAKKLDLREMALNQYDNLLISKVNGYVNIRKEPNTGSDQNVIGKLPGKAAGEILETLDGWYKIRSGNITGYVSSEYVATGQEARDLALSSASLMAVIKEERMNVRKEPSTESAIWTQLSREERYPVVGQEDGWVKIELDAGDQDADAAYVSTQNNYVEVRYALTEAIKFSPLEEKVNQEASRRTQIVNYALQFVGNPYVWGGVSLTKGADCSGFTLSVLKKYGISLPHYSVSQSKMGRAVKSSEMRPGDLIFYANSAGTINHVSMYIGNGQVVHAASRKSGIKISTWNYRTPKAIRNVID